jgi:predicted nucleotidyltransferase
MSGRRTTPELHPLQGPPRFKRAELVRQLKTALRGRAQEAYLFGSYARGAATSWSDIDLLIVANSSRPFVERFRDFLDIIHLFSPMDLVVYTPAEWRTVLRERRAFWTHARKTWVQLAGLRQPGKLRPLLGA